jgi:hypothetical protein
LVGERSERRAIPGALTLGFSENADVANATVDLSKLVLASTLEDIQLQKQVFVAWPQFLIPVSGVLLQSNSLHHIMVSISSDSLGILSPALQTGELYCGSWQPNAVSSSQGAVPSFALPVVVSYLSKETLQLSRYLCLISRLT